MRFAAAVLILCPTVAFAQSFQSRGIDDRERATRDSARRNHLSRGDPGVRRPRPRVQRRVHGARDGRRRADPGNRRHGARRRAAAVSDGHGRREHAVPELLRVPRSNRSSCGRMEASQSDPDAALQFGMLVGIPIPRQVNALSNVQSARRTLRHVQRRVRRASLRGPAAGERAGRACEEFRQQPDALERATRARRVVRPQSRPRRDADVLRRVVVQRRRSTRRTCAPRAAPTCATRWTRRPGTRTIVARAARARARSSTRRRTLSEYNGGGGDPGGAESGDANASAPVTAARGAAWRATRTTSPYETGGSSSRLRGLRRRQSRDVLDLRRDRRLVPPAGVAQRRRGAS